MFGIFRVKFFLRYPKLYITIYLVTAVKKKFNEMIKLKI